MALENRDTTPKITTKILNGLRREQKSAATFFNIQKAYDKINRNKTFEQLDISLRRGRSNGHEVLAR